MVTRNKARKLREEYRDELKGGAEALALCVAGLAIVTGLSLASAFLSGKAENTEQTAASVRTANE